MLEPDGGKGQDYQRKGGQYKTVRDRYCIQKIKSRGVKDA